MGRIASANKAPESSPGETPVIFLLICPEMERHQADDQLGVIMHPKQSNSAREEVGLKTAITP
ncbi:MAG: hypothetical protein D6698_05070 [Gammaproteobacteria bacterium]|nr:MAG: hypothetical protein D6698_05070 [Gammaproteobacteria bacterium]